VHDFLEYVHDWASFFTDCIYENVVGINTAREFIHYGKIGLHFFRLSKVRFDPATPARARPDAKSPQARSRPPANPFPSNFASPSQVFIKCMSDVSCASDPEYDPDEDASESSGKL
jgi:hypothetical protein